jgi:hypothetical protein
MRAPVRFESEMKKVFALAWLAGCASSALAQQGSPHDPASPSAPVRKPTYVSAFEAYRPLAEPKPAPWREVNEEVRRLGGHAGHVKPAAKPPAATPVPGAK